MKRDWIKNNRLMVMLLLCICLMIVFDVFIIKNLLQYNTLNEHIKSVHLSMQELESKLDTQKDVSASKNVEKTNGFSETDGESDKESDNRLETEFQTEVRIEERTNLDLSVIMDNIEDIGGQWAASVVDLSDGTFYGIQENYSMQSASVIKVFIMAAVYGRICYPEDEVSAIYAPEQYEGELKDLLTNMITVSDNVAANRLVELLGAGDFQIGKEVVNSFCQEKGYKDTHIGRRFMEENPQDDNYTTARDCAKILQDLYYGKCVCQEASNKMLSFLQNQTNKTKIPSGLPEGIVCANKTGEMPEGYGLGCIENDIAIVYGSKKDYVICVLSNELEGKNEEAREKIGNISRCVYESFQ